MRIGLVGAGKRMTNVYAPILQKLQKLGSIDVVGFTTRSQSTAQRFSDATGIKAFKTREELVAQNPDYLLVCVNASASSAVIGSTMHHGIPILCETPLDDPRLVESARKYGVSVGVIEQWPYLPLEQFKEKVYASGIVSRPFLVQNDCRSYDYHAIAQLRTYIGRQHRPTSAFAHRVLAPLAEHENSEGLRVDSSVDSWEIGTIAFENGATLMHQFAYACKTAPFRSLQSLRAYSSDGTIITGRMIDRTNDYEIIDVMFLNAGKTERMSVVRHSTEHGSTEKIVGKCSDGQTITWWNEFSDAALSDADAAIATHIMGMQHVVNDKKQPLYTLDDAVIDQLLVSAMKQSCGIQNRLEFR
jgi:predicted dehydrogenase